MKKLRRGSAVFQSPGFINRALHSYVALWVCLLCGLSVCRVTLKNLLSVCSEIKNGMLLIFVSKYLKSQLIAA